MKKFEHWDYIIENSEKWWNHELERPLIQMSLKGIESSLEKPKLPFCKYITSFGLDAKNEDIMELSEYEMATRKCLGDAFPIVGFAHAPDSLSVYLGSEVEAQPTTAWVHAKEQIDNIEDLSFKFDANNKYYKQITSVLECAVDYFKEKAVIRTPELGSGMDTIVPFREQTSLLMDLYDCPDEIHRINREMQKAYFECFENCIKIISKNSLGYTTWTTVFSTKPFEMVQCDFSYMISPDQFDEFVKPYIVEQCQRIPRTIFHIDGPGILNHLDSILSIEELDGIQWIPGAGEKWCQHWPEVYKKTRDAGKLIQLFGGMDTLDGVAETLGSAKDIVFMTACKENERAKAEEFLNKYNVPIMG